MRSVFVDRLIWGGPDVCVRLVRQGGSSASYPGRVLVLTLDTATPAVTAGVVDVQRQSITVRAERSTVNARAHGELLMPNVLEAVRAAGVALRDLQALVCGVGPGPYTGLRVGVMTAAALAHSLGIPAHPVCSLDAIAADTDTAESFVVLTDARRREVYWAAYDTSGLRTAGPYVGPPAEVVSDVQRRVEYMHPRPHGLALIARDALLSGEQPAALTPLYLRRPHAAEPGPRKRVST